MSNNDNFIKLSVKGRYSHKMTLAEKAIFDAFDVYYLDDPALFESSLREEIMCFSSLSVNDLNQYSDERFRYLIDELSFQIKQMNNAQWEGFINSFWVFFDKNPFGFSAAKDNVLSSYMRTISHYLLSANEECKLYTSRELVDLLSSTEKIINSLDIYWAKKHLGPYIEKDIIQVFRLTDLFEEIVFDILIDELDEDMVFNVLNSD